MYGLGSHATSFYGDSGASSSTGRSYLTHVNQQREIERLKYEMEQQRLESQRREEEARRREEEALQREEEARRRDELLRQEMSEQRRLIDELLRGLQATPSFFPPRRHRDDFDPEDSDTYLSQNPPANLD